MLKRKSSVYLQMHWKPNTQALVQVDVTEKLNFSLFHLSTYGNPIRDKVRQIIHYPLGKYSSSIFEVNL